MKQDTYDIKAYEFAILISNRIYFHDDENYKEMFNMCIDSGSFRAIPFSEVDGLLIGDISNFFHTRGFAFVSYTRIASAPQDKITPIYKLFITPSVVGQNGDLAIDKYVQDTMTNLYNGADEKFKKIFRCFFERYQYGSYEKTTERVKKIEQQIG